MSKPILRLTLLLSLCFSSLFVNSQTWTATAGTPGLIRDMAVYNGELYVVGGFDMGGGLKGIAKWNSVTSSWDSLGNGMGGQYQTVGCLAVYNGELYVGGHFDSWGFQGSGVQRGIRKWNGTSWSAVGTGGIGAGSPSDRHVFAMAVHNGELYIAGRFQEANHQPALNIAKWNGTTMSAVGGGLPAITGNGLTALVSHNGDLYVGGPDFVSKWDGNTFTNVGTGLTNPVFDMVSLNGDLYVGGCFDSSTGVAANHVAKWDGTSWSALGQGIDSGAVFSLAVHNGQLYAGGLFKMAGGQPANNIAKWDGASWIPAGSGTNGEVLAFATNNSELFVGGGFTTAGSFTASKLAKLVPCTSAPQLNSISGNNPACQNSTPVYSVPANPTEVLLYSWTLPTGWTGSSASNSIAATPGTAPGNITLTTSNNCGNSNTASLPVTSVPVASITISEIGGLLFTSAVLATYQWYYNGSPIPGATGQSYMTSSDGVYQLIGTDANGCIVESNFWNFLLEVVSVSSSSGIQLYPNPNNGLFTISGYSPSSNAEVQYEIRDVTGRLIATGTAQSYNNSFTKEVDVRHIAKGMYVLRLHSNGATSAHMFIVE